MPRLGDQKPEDLEARLLREISARRPRVARLEFREGVMRLRQSGYTAQPNLVSPETWHVVRGVSDRVAPRHWWDG